MSWRRDELETGDAWLHIRQVLIIFGVSNRAYVSPLDSFKPSMTKNSFYMGR